MKRVISFALVLCLLVLFGICGAFADDEPETEEEEAPSWTIGHYVDDFGDETGGIYLTATFKGTFSNTAATDEKLKAVVSYIPSDGMFADSFSFQLFEYNDTKATYLNGSQMTIKVKVDDVVNSAPLHGIAPNGDLSLSSNTNEKKQCFSPIFDTLTEAEKDVRCIIEIDSSKYSFTMDGSGFSDGVEQLMAVNDYYSGTEIKRFDVVVEDVTSLVYMNSIPNLPYSAQAYTYGGAYALWNTEEDCRTALQIYLDYLEKELGLMNTGTDGDYHYQTVDGKTISLYVREPGPADKLLSYKVYTVDVSIE